MRNPSDDAVRRTLVLVDTVYPTEKMRLPEGPQIAVAGRSNVGKSTLINRLAGSNKLAKTSSTPGKTRSLNFYRVEPEGFHLADLPGYGYAKRSKSERKAWAGMIERYLSGTPDLAAVMALLDCRLPPQTLDIELVSYVQGLNLGLIPVMTKADKAKQNERAKVARQWKEVLRTRTPLMVSAKTGMNIQKLWTALLTAAGFDAG